MLAPKFDVEREMEGKALESAHPVHEVDPLVMTLWHTIHQTCLMYHLRSQNSRDWSQQLQLKSQRYGKKSGFDKLRISQ